MRGRKPISDNIRLVTSGRIHRKKPEAQDRPHSTPVCPDIVATLPAAQAKWTETITKLEEAGTLEATDADAIAGYCLEWAHFIECESFVRENGAVVVIRNDKGETKTIIVAPQESQRLKHLDRIMKYQQELGLTPTSRTRVKPGKPIRKSDNPFEAFNK